MEDRDGINFSSVFTLQCALYDLIDFKLSFSQGNSYQIWHGAKTIVQCLLANDGACSWSSLNDCLNVVTIKIQLYIIIIAGPREARNPNLNIDQRIAYYACAPGL